MDSIRIRIFQKHVGLTIKELFKDVFYVGRAKIEELRNSHDIYVNDICSSIETRLNKDDILEIYFHDEIDFVPYSKELEVVYEDDYLLIVNKPRDMIVHPDDKTKSGTLVNVVANYYKKKGINRKVRFINRLDKDTTGLVLFAKDFLSEAKLHHDIESHEVKRDYLAICLNRFSSLDGTVDAPMSGDRHDNKKQVIAKHGKTAITDYKVIKKLNKLETLVELSLRTGRTHQIRVHMAYINHPVKGDKLYGLGGDTLYLHGYRLSLFHPITNEYLRIERLPDFAK